MSRVKANYREKLHYLRDGKWLSGELCYWRNNPNYSDKTKAKLEKRMNDMCDKRIIYEIYRKSQ